MNSTEQVQEIFVEDIIPNRFQPRLTFDEKALQELAESIKIHGVIQPLVLRKIGNKYEIIAGERRFKASQMAGLKKVPAIVREMTDNESAEVALIENVQRKNLSSIEEAQSYKSILERGYLTQEELAKKIGVAQPTIANKMRLLNLCDEVQNALLNEQISERHARSLLVLKNPDEQKAMLKRIISERLTVKQLDTEIKKLQNGTDDSGNNEKTLKDDTLNMEENKPIQNKNIFGLNIQEPTDLEQTAPNLNTGVEETETPLVFNPFSSNTGVQTQFDIPVENKVSDEIEMFDMFGDNIKAGNSNDTLDGNENKSKPSLGEQISIIRDAVQNIENAGFKLEKEEYDFEDVYQIIIKIQKPEK